MVGFDATLIEEKLHLISGLLSCTSSLSVLNAGFEISLPKEWKLTLTAQIPVSGSSNENGGTIQLSEN